MPENIIVDTGYWFALFTPGDGKHLAAERIYETIENNRVLIAWPSLYETLNSKLVKHSRAKSLREFERILKRPWTRLIEDFEYRDEALGLTFETPQPGRRGISLVDHVIRLMIEDKRLKIDWLLTFNYSDFDDICHKCRIPIVIPAKRIP